MGNTKITGIVLTESNLGDFDKMLTILTPNHGKVSCVAKGSRRNKSALLATSQMFCFAEYMVYKGANTYNINSAESIEFFYNIRTDLDKLAYAVHINKIVQDVAQEEQNSYNILQLLLNTLYMISETDMNLELILNIFKLRLLCILGFKPSVNECKVCKDKEEIRYFSIKDSGFKCKACGKSDKSSIEISESTMNAIKYIVIAPAKKIYSFNIKDTALEEFKLVVKIYFNEKLEKEYKLEKLY